MSDTVIPFTGPAGAARPPRGLAPTPPSRPTRLPLPNRAERRRRRRRRAGAGGRSAGGTGPSGPRRWDLPADPRAQVARNVARFGLHLVHVGEGCDCPDCTERPLPVGERFGYTVGLTEADHPELAARGLGARDTADLLNRWGRAVLAGDRLEAGHLLCDGPAGRRWELVPAEPGLAVWADGYYARPVGDPVPVLELVPTDRRCLCTDCG